MLKSSLCDAHSQRNSIIFARSRNFATYLFTVILKWQQLKLHLRAWPQASNIVPQHCRRDFSTFFMTLYDLIVSVSSFSKCLTAINYNITFFSRFSTANFSLNFRSDFYVLFWIRMWFIYILHGELRLYTVKKSRKQAGGERGQQLWKSSQL